MIHYTKDAEFLRQLQIVPFDYEVEQAEALQREDQASYAFRRAQEREEANRGMRGILFGFVFSFFALAIVFLVCCPWIRR